MFTCQTYIYDSVVGVSLFSSFVLNTHLFMTPRCPQPGSHLSVHKVFHLLKEEISQVCHCPAASSQNSQACHQPPACPKRDAVLQQTFRLDSLLSFYHRGGPKLITTSLFTIPCFEILQGYITFLMPSAVLGEGGSTRKITWVAPARQLEVLTSRKTSQSSECMCRKAGRTMTGTSKAPEP